jgi:hypothetical protein
MKVFADDNDARITSRHDYAIDEGNGILVRGLRREMHNAHFVDSEGFKLTQSIIQGGQHLGGALRRKYFGGRGIKGNDDGVKVLIVSESHHVTEHSLVTLVHSVEHPNGRNGTSWC